MRLCDQCGATLSDDKQYCPECGFSCSYGSKKVVKTKKKTYEGTYFGGSSRYHTNRNILAIVLTSAGMIVWWFVPFLQMTMIGDPINAILIAFGAFKHYGQLADAPQFWAAWGVGLCMLISAICLLCHKGGTARIYNLLGAGIMVWITKRVHDSTYSTEEFYEFIGAGFWIIFAILIITAFVCEKEES